MVKQLSKKIIGLIGLPEEKILFEKSKNIELNESDILVEIGPLFGRATDAIIRGLTLNPHYKRKNKLYVYDSFECDVNNFSAQEILNLAKEENMLSHIRFSKKIINYEKILNFNLQSHIDSGDVVTIKNESFNIKPPTNASIALMRLNFSKKYSEFKSIIFRFLPQTKINCILVCDDYFSHWSASIILVTGILIDRKCLMIREPAGLSVIFDVIKVPNKTDLIELDLSMQNSNESLRFFDVVINDIKKIRSNDSEMLVSKIILAKIQWLYAKGEFGSARDTMLDFFKKSGNSHLLNSLITSYLDLLGNGFSINQMYKANQIIAIPE